MPRSQKQMFQLILSLISKLVTAPASCLSMVKMSTLKFPSHWPHLILATGITEVRKSSDQYCIIGAGKTGADAVLHLLAQSVSPDKIIWIIPNDLWFLNRKYFTFDRDWVPNVIRQFKCITSDDNKTWQDALLRSSSLSSLSLSLSNIITFRCSGWKSSGISFVLTKRSCQQEAASGRSVRETWRR